MSSTDIPYRRILLKLSGEALLGAEGYGIDPKVLTDIAAEIRDVGALGVQVGVVIGGGNIFRGAGLARSGMDRATADHMGMLATVINSLALQDALEREGVVARVMSALQMHEVCEDFIRRRAVRHLEKGRVAILAAGIGNPYFTTDTAAALRANELGCEVLLKATKVDGIYDKDPHEHEDAIRFDHLSYMDCLEKRLSVMDSTAFSLCMDNRMPILVFDLQQENSIQQAVKGEDIGTLVN